MPNNRIWNIKFNSKADFDNLANLIAKSDLFEFKLNKIFRIEVNEKKKCLKCSNTSYYELVATYQKKFHSEFVCHYCLVQAIFNYLNKLLNHLPNESFHLKQENYAPKLRIRSKKQLIKIFEDKDVDFEAYYDNTLTLSENLTIIQENLPFLLEEYITI